MAIADYWISFCNWDPTMDHSFSRPKGEDRDPSLAEPESDGTKVITGYKMSHTPHMNL
jgi:hypothetical protein